MKMGKIRYNIVVAIVASHNSNTLYRLGHKITVQREQNAHSKGPVPYTNSIVVSPYDPMVGDYSVASKLIGCVPYYDPTVVDISGVINTFSDAQMLYDHLVGS